ncbi:MAG: hypothetical protein ACQESK_07910 [Bacteroidota bacterium]
MNFKTVLITGLCVGVLLACETNKSKSSSTAAKEPTEEKLIEKSENKNLTPTEFLNQKYEEYNISETYEKTVDGEELTLAKVDTNNSEVDVYLAYNTNNELKYFAELNWENLQGTGIDFELAEEESFELDKYDQEKGASLFEARFDSLEEIAAQP